MATKPKQPGEKGKVETWHDVMKKYKPDITLDEASYVLMNETCYPFDNELTRTQIEQFFNKIALEGPNSKGR